MSRYQIFDTIFGSSSDPVTPKEIREMVNAHQSEFFHYFTSFEAKWAPAYLRPDPMAL